MMLAKLLFALLLLASPVLGAVSECGDDKCTEGHETIYSCLSDCHRFERAIAGTTDYTLFYLELPTLTFTLLFIGWIFKKKTW